MPKPGLTGSIPMAERRGGGVRRWYAGWTLWMVSASAAWAIPAFDEVRADFKPSDTLILSREGEVLQRLRTDATVRRGQWVPLAEVSPALRTALVLSEDKRFFEHSGVDWRAASAAAWGNLRNQRTRGASTITMQLAGLLDGDWRQGPGGRTVGQKLGQTGAAQVLDGGGTTGGRRWLLRWCARPMPGPRWWRNGRAGCCAICRPPAARTPRSAPPQPWPVWIAMRWTSSPPPPCSAAHLMRAKAWRRTSPATCFASAPAKTAQCPSVCPAPCARRCSVLPCRACSSTCASCAGAMWKTAPCWCSTTPRARCWPGWGLQGN